MKPLLPLAVLSVSCLFTAQAQDAPATPPKIVSGWKLNGGDTVITFLFDGTYYFVDGYGARPGMERGIFEWDDGSGAFTSEALVDTNGDAGLSHPIGATSIAINGNTLTYTVAGEGSFTFSRITDGAQPAVGSWFLPEEKCMLTLLADGSYYFCQEKNDAPDGHDGIERGTYLWNPVTKAFTGTPSVDTSGDTGLSHQLPGVTMDLAGNRMTITEGTEQFLLRRVNANAAVRIDNDFEVNKFASYEQTSGAAPVIMDYGGAGYMHGITGSGVGVVRQDDHYVQRGTRKRVELTNHATYSSSTMVPEIQAIQSWSDASVRIKLNCGSVAARLSRRPSHINGSVMSSGSS